jgi:hypothetical protein
MRNLAFASAAGAVVNVPGSTAASSSAMRTAKA